MSEWDPSIGGRRAALDELIGRVLERAQEAVYEGELDPADARVRDSVRLLRDLIREVDLPDAAAAQLLSKLDAYLVAPPSRRMAAGISLNRDVREFAFSTVPVWAPQTDEERREEIVAMLSRIQALDELEDARRDVSEARDRISDIEESVRESAGSTSAASLGNHFADQAQKEEEAASSFRTAALALLAALCLAAVYCAFERQEVFTTGLDKSYGRLVFSIPFVLLLALLTRESGQHRKVARDLRAREVQLKTLPAFVEGIPDPVSRSTVMTMAGGALFSPNGVDDTTDGRPTLEQTATLTQVLGALRELLERDRART